MSMWRSALLVLFTAIAVQFLPYFLKSKLPLHFGGNISTGFEPVQRAFKEIFEKGWEEEGAAFAVYHNGKLVVDLWGGYADQNSMRQWQRDTMALVMSSTKIVGAITVAVLVDRGLIEYDGLMSKYWPEFAKNGKENITVSMVLNHQAGIAWLDPVIPRSDAFNSDYIRKLIEDQSPNWKPGTSTGYHAFTWGWIVEELVKKVDPKHRNFSTFFAQEIVQPYGLDFYLGLPMDLFHRVARVSLEGLSGIIGQALNDKNFLKVLYSMSSHGPDSRLVKVFRNVPWLTQQGRWPFNDPDIHKRENVACGGIGTARDLAKLASLFSEAQLVSEKTLDLIKEPSVLDMDDIVMGMFDAYRGHGFMYTKRPGQNSDDDWLIGHSGFGGMYVKMDLKNRLSFAYLTNSLKAGVGDVVRTWSKLQTSLYESKF